MFNSIGRAASTAAGGILSRRNLLRTAGVSAVSTGVALTAGCSADSAQQSAPAQAQRHRTRLVLLGTGGGPTITRRAGISTAVVYDDRVYLVDLGTGAQGRLVEAGLGGGGLTDSLVNVRGIFLTHMHSDHVTEWPALYATSPNNTGGAVPSSPIKVFGPGDRGVLPRVFPQGRPAPEVINPAEPTPGTANMTELLRKAFANDFNDRFRDSNFNDPNDIFDVREIDISPYWTVDETGIPPELPSGTKIPVWQDGDVRITATLVDHRPMAPAFAFRFDTPDGTVVVSGDTGPSRNLIDFAAGADHLVHEVIDPEWVDGLVASLPKQQREPVREHLLAAHTTIEQVGRDVAEAAGVQNLVLSHLVPGDDSVHRWGEAQRGFSGKLIVGDDLMQLGVGAPRD